MIKDLYRGLRCLFVGFSLIRQRGLRRFVVAPLTVNVAVFAGLLWLGGEWFAGLLDEYLPEALDVAVLKYALWILFGGALLLIAFYTFALVANFLAAPFNGVLAERVEQALTGNRPPSSGRVLAVLGTVAEELLAEIHKLLYLVAWMLPFAALMAIPGLIIVLGPVLGPAWFVLSAWLLALEYVDYPASNHEIRFKELRRLLRGRRALALGFGGAVAIGTMIPVVNLFVMPAAVAGGTALWVNELSRSRNGGTPRP